MTPTRYNHDTPPTNTAAILALVFAFIFWPLSIVFGHVARHQMRQTGEAGHGLALAGLILSYLILAFIVLVVVIAVAAGLSGPH